jgi:hypothetical protein
VWRRSQSDPAADEAETSDLEGSVLQTNVVESTNVIGTATKVELDKQDGWDEQPTLLQPTFSQPTLLQQSSHGSEIGWPESLDSVDGPED